MSRELQPWRPTGPVAWPSNRPAALGERFFQARLLHAHLHRYTDGLRRRWWVLALALGLIGGPALVYAWHKPPIYQSAAMMWLSGKLNLPGEGVYSEELSSYIGTQAQLLKSPTILGRAFKRVQAHFRSLAGADCPFELTVRSSQKTSVLELRATGPLPAPTRAFLDAVMEEYLAFKKESREQASKGAVSGITDQVKEVEDQIQEQQDRLAAFQASNNVSLLTEHGLSAGTHLAQLAGKISDAQTEVRILDMLSPREFVSLGEGSPVNLIRAEGAGPPLGGPSGPAGEGLASQTTYYQALQQLQILKAKRQQFAGVLRPAHSKMVKLSHEIDGLEQLLEQLRQGSEEQARRQMDNRKKALEVEIQNLQNQCQAWQTNAADASRKLVAYERMKQDLQRQQALYDRLMSLLQTVDVSKNLGDAPLEPMAPASPAQVSGAKRAIAAAGLFLALLVGLGAFFFLEFLDDRFTSALELSLQLPAEVLGQIPRSSLRLPGGARPLLPLTTAQPAFAESFRNLRSSLLFMSGQEPPPKVVLVTSAIPKEGKTTVASNLAGILAMSGARVLLVDADFRRGSVHRAFRVRRKPGLLEALSEGVPLAEAIVETGQPNLFLMPVGDSGDYTSDVLLRYRVDRLLKVLAKSYDHVVIDSAPVLATDDAACLGPFTDGAFLVVRAEYTSSRMTQEAWARLSRRNVKVLGIIYNCAPPSSDYYCHYSREYGERSPSLSQPGHPSGNGAAEAAAGQQ